MVFLLYSALSFQMLMLTNAGERVGCLVLATSSEQTGTNSQTVLEKIQRSEISNPPAFGARIAATILADDGLRNAWFEDLKTMSGRIQSMRKRLHEGLTRNCMYSITAAITMRSTKYFCANNTSCPGELGSSPGTIRHVWLPRTFACCGDRTQRLVYLILYSDRMALTQCRKLPHLHGAELASVDCWAESGECRVCGSVYCGCVEAGVVT